MTPSSINRRSFFRNTSLLGLPLFLGLGNALGAAPLDTDAVGDPERINFFADGEFLPPSVYAKKLGEIIAANTQSLADGYGKGGAVSELEKKFAEVTGKEKAIFMPSGTMANQLAIRVLSGNNTKVYVQETSHVYRDEADAAQSVHNKRLIPLAKEKATFTLDELKEAIDYHSKGEVFESGTGVISIENPVRRRNGEIFSIEEIKKISAYCKTNNYKLHLDGARLYIASAWSGVSIKEYSSYFDTVYISLYKYFKSAGGAVLCGEAKVIDQMTHLIKIYGGNMFQSWPYAAMALESLKGFEERMAKAKILGKDLMDLLTASGEFSITPTANGSNIFNLSFTHPVEFQKFGETLAGKKIFMNWPDDNGVVHFFINETLLKRDITEIRNEFVAAVKAAKK